MASIPKEYQWILKEQGPLILREMLGLYGVKEYAGKKNNPEIIAWVKEVQPFLGIDYTRDAVPWCGLAMGVAAVRAKWTPPRVCVRAKEWAKFGNARPLDKAELGNVLVFNRKGGGHVGLYIAEDDKSFHVLGGNQQDEVNFTRIDKKRLIAVRECPWRWLKPRNARPIYMDKVGTMSHNEY